MNFCAKRKTLLLLQRILISCMSLEGSNLKLIIDEKTKVELVSDTGEYH